MIVKDNHTNTNIIIKSKPIEALGENHIKERSPSKSKNRNKE